MAYLVEVAQVLRSQAIQENRVTVHEMVQGQAGSLDRVEGAVDVEVVAVQERRLVTCRFLRFHFQGQVLRDPTNLVVGEDQHRVGRDTALIRLAVYHRVNISGLPHYRPWP